MNYKIIRDGVKVPSKRLEDAGYDLYGVDCDELRTKGYIVDLIKHDGEINETSVVNGLCGGVETMYRFPAGEVVMIPIGLATEIIPGVVGIIKERGSTGSKGLAVRCGVIDSGYRGEWFIGIVNVGREDVYYPIEKAIAQVVFVKYESPEWELGELGESERGEGKLGSSEK